MLIIFLKPILLLAMPGGSEWILILLVILLFFGGKKIPDLMRGIGKGMREFNDAKENLKNEMEAGMKDKDVIQDVPQTATSEPDSISPVPTSTNP